MERGIHMENIKIGDRLKIHCYKHDGKIYRTWGETIVLDVNEDYIVVANDRTKVTELDGRTWRTKEPAIIYFYKKNWFNVIAQMKEAGIFYYCNIATPFIVDDKTIKYIDYDLDLRVFPDDTYKILDQNEYEYHKKKMKYSEEIHQIVMKELDNLIGLHKKKTGPFSSFIINYYYSIYKEFKKNEK